MRYMKVSWTTTTDHQRYVRVPDDFDAMDPDDKFADELSEIEDDNSFDGCSRDGIAFREMDETKNPLEWATAVMNADDFPPDM